MLPTKVHVVKAMVFPVVVYGCESWTVQKAERQRIDAFELWCWRRLLRITWTTRRSKKSILRRSVLCVHWRDWCWIWNSNTLTIWYKEVNHLKRPWSWERLRAGGEGDNRGWDGWVVSPTQGTWVWVNSRNWWWTGKPGILHSMRLQRVDTTEPLNWTELNVCKFYLCKPHLKKAKNDSEKCKICIILELNSSQTQF